MKEIIIHKNNVHISLFYEEDWDWPNQEQKIFISLNNTSLTINPFLNQPKKTLSFLTLDTNWDVDTSLSSMCSLKNKNRDETEFQKESIAFKKNLLFDKQVIHEIEFEQFQQEYKTEVKENYLMRQICSMIESFAKNTNSSELCQKRIHEFMLVANDSELPLDVRQEFQNQAQKSSVDKNGYGLLVKNTWDYFFGFCVNKK